MGKQTEPEKIIRLLRDAEAELAGGRTVAQVVQKLGISEQTYYRWRQRYGGMQVDEAKRLKELEAENARLKRLVAELAPARPPGPGIPGCTRPPPTATSAAARRPPGRG